MAPLCPTGLGRLDALCGQPGIVRLGSSHSGRAAEGEPEKHRAGFVVRQRLCGRTAAILTMRFIPSQLRLGFLAKVLVPVVTVMVLLVVGTIVFVNRQITAQFQNEAAKRLLQADIAFNNSHKQRAKNLWLRYRNIPDEPRFKAVAQKGDPETLRFQLRGLLESDLGAEVVFFTNERGKHVAHASRDSEFQILGFQDRTTDLIKRALDGQATVETIVVADRLFDVVCVPVRVTSVVGTLTFGEVGRASL